MTTGLFLLVLLSAFIHATWNIAAKRVAGNIGVLWLGQVLGALVLLPAALYFAPQVAFDSPRVWAHLIFTGATQAIYFILLAGAYERFELSVVYPIARGLGVAGSALAGVLVFGESISLLGGIGIGTICLGTVVLGLARGKSEDRRVLWYALGIGWTLASGNTNDKLAVGIVPPTFYMFAMFLIASAASAPLALGRWRTQLRHAFQEQKKTAAIIGLGSLGGYLIILFAFQRGPLSYIVAFRELSVVLGVLYGVLVLREPLPPRKALGIGLIVCGLIFVKFA